MVFFKSTTDPTIRSTTDLVILSHLNQREIVPLPQTYQDVIDITREIFELDRDAVIVLKTDDPDACRGQAAVINKRAWDSLRLLLEIIEVEVKDDQQQKVSPAETALSARGTKCSDSDVDDNDYFLVVRPSKSFLRGKVWLASVGDEETASPSADDGGSPWIGSDSEPSASTEEAPVPGVSLSGGIKDAPTQTFKSRAKFTSSAEEDALPRHQPVQVKYEKPFSNGVPSDSKQLVSGQNNSMNDDYTSASQQSQSQSRSPSQQTEEPGSTDKFMISVEHGEPSMSSFRQTQALNTLPVDEDSPVVVDSEVRGLLDKLTMERFESTSNKIIDWANKSEKEKDGRILIQVIHLIIERAIDEAALSDMYARLCRKMTEQISPNVQVEGIRNPEGKPITGGQLFRKYLLDRCQEDFERGWAAQEAPAAAAKVEASENEATLHPKEYLAAQKARRQGLGLMKFIGELFKLQILTERIMHECIKKLLSNVDNPEEEEIESLCQLLTTVGQILDTPRAKLYMDIYFTRMKELAKNPKVSSRMQCTLQDVIELRERRWIPPTMIALWV